MSDRSYSTGQAATELGVSQEHIRQLAQAGKIPGAFRTPGRQIRIPDTTVEDLRKNGLPQLPRFTPSQPMANGDHDQPPPPSPPEESPRVLRAIEESLIRKAQREAREHEVQILSSKVELEQKLDFFRTREREHAERTAEEKKQRDKREAEERAARKRADCLTFCDQYIIKQLRWIGAPGEVQIRTQQLARQHFSELNPLPEIHMWRKILDSIIETESAKWKRQSERDKILHDARDVWLPRKARESPSYGQLSEWQLRAIGAAEEAMNSARPGATIEELRTLAQRAVQKVVAVYEYVEMFQDLCQSVDGLLGRNATHEELKCARQVVVNALRTVPDGMSRRQLEQIRDAALGPFQAAIAQRTQAEENRRKNAEAAERMKRETASKLRAVEFRADSYLSRVHDYLRALAERKKIAFSGFTDRWVSGETLKRQVRPIIVQELTQMPEMSDDALRRRIDALVDQQLEDWPDE